MILSLETKKSNQEQRPSFYPASTTMEIQTSQKQTWSWEVFANLGPLVQLIMPALCGGCHHAVVPELQKV